MVSYTRVQKPAEAGKRASYDMFINNPSTIKPSTTRETQSNNKQAINKAKDPLTTQAVR